MNQIYISSISPTKIMFYFNIEGAIKYKNKICYIGNDFSTLEQIEGPYIHFYYIYTELRKQNYVSVFNSSKKRDFISLFLNDIIWIEYPCGRFPLFMAILSRIIKKKKIILRVRDLPVEQAKSLHTNIKSWIFYKQLKFIEKITVQISDVLILSIPDFLNILKPHSKNIFFFLPGVSEKLLLTEEIKQHKEESDKRILLYAGSLSRGGMIQNIISLFNDIEGWELWIVGKEEEELYNLNLNTKYLGFMPYSNVIKLYSKVDATIIPYPKGGYFDICIPLKIGEVLASCKPVISTRLPLLSKYVRELGLSQNMIYVDAWTKEELVHALNKAESLQISAEHTFKCLSNITWEKKTSQLITDVFAALEDKTTS